MSTNVTTFTPPPSMVMTQDRAFEILDKLIAAASAALTAPAVTGPDGTVKLPTDVLASVPTTWAAIINAHAAAFPAPVVVAEAPKKKRKNRPAKEGSQQGWPSNVTKLEYKAWRLEQLQARNLPEDTVGSVEGINPHIYKAERDAKTAVSGDGGSPAKSEGLIKDLVGAAAGTNANPQADPESTGASTDTNAGADNTNTAKTEAPRVLAGGKGKK